MTGAILAGGKSSRFGQNKALYPVNGRSMIEWIIDTLKKFTEELFIVANDPGQYAFLNIKVHEDRYPGLGPLAGLHTALTHARTNQVFVVACDMPFLCEALIKAMIEAAKETDTIVPYTEKGPEPLHAIYHKGLLLVVEHLIKGGRRSMRDLLAVAPHKRLHAQRFQVLNINTKKELENAIHLYDKCLSKKFPQRRKV